MQNNYTSRTASLKATIADVKKLDAKSIDAQSIKINGKPVGTGVTDIRKGNSTPYDLWPNGVQEENGATVVYPLGHNKIDISTLSDDVKTHYKHKVANIVDNVCYDKNNNIISYIDTLAIEDGTSLFNVSPGTMVNFTNINIDLSNLICGKQMFKNRYDTKSIIANFDKLIDGYAMFHNCANLESIQGINFNSLLNGYAMFYSCGKFDSSNLELKKLSYADSMFMFCNSLKTFAIDLPNLVRGNGMFGGNDNLVTFVSDLSNLVYGQEMFSNSKNLTTFISELSSLIAGHAMFAYCKLSPESMSCIANLINDIKATKKQYADGIIPYVTLTNGVYSAERGFMSNGTYVYTYYGPEKTTTTIGTYWVGRLGISIDVVNDEATVETQLENYAHEAGFESWAALKQKFIDKGWNNVAFYFGGGNTSITLNEDEQFRGVPIYAQLLEVVPAGDEYTEEEKQSAEYCTEDGSRYYNIDWGHDVADRSQYQYFGSLLEACGYYGVIPKKYLEEI